MIITIDGPVATGKSTIAKSLARAIGFIYFDTGAMYRALTYALMKQGIRFDETAQMQKFLETFDFDIKIMHGERRYWVGKEDVTDIIRSDKITREVSRVAAVREVREKLVAIQRELAKGVNAVFEGRDMGSVVFPDADVKIFLTGRPEVRAKRRFEEIVAKYPDQAQGLTLEQCLQDLNERDHFDSTRSNSPLIQSPDAHVVDTSDLTIDEIVFKILEYQDTRKTAPKDT